MSNIGSYIKKIRFDNGGGRDFWSLRSVAERANISSTYLSQLETGENEKPSPDILKKLSPALRVSYQSLMQAAGYLEDLSPFSLPVKDTKIPIVSLVKGDDDMGFEFENFEPHEYDFIDFSNCRAARLTTNSMAPLAYCGQTIIYSQDESVQSGDLVFIKLKSGEQFFKRFVKNGNRTITLEPLNVIHYQSRNIDESEIEFVFKVKGVAF